MKVRLLLGLFTVLVAIDNVLGWLWRQWNERLATCAEHERYGTYVWHEHAVWRWRWLASHSVLDDGRRYLDTIPWCELRDDDIQVRVFPAAAND